MSRSRLLALLAIAVTPVVVVSSSQGQVSPIAPSSPYTPSTPPTTPNLTFQADLTAAITKAFSTIKFTTLVNGKKTATVALPVAGSGTYTVTLLYRQPGKKYKAVSKNTTTVPVGGTTATFKLKGNATGKKIAPALGKKKSFLVRVTLTYVNAAGTTVTSTFKITLPR